MFSLKNSARKGLKIGQQDSSSSQGSPDDKSYYHSLQRVEITPMEYDSTKYCYYLLFTIPPYCISGFPSTFFAMTTNEDHI